MESEANRSFWDTPLVELLKPTWEKAAYALILVIAVVSRFWNLGPYAMSHDESLHSLYSYYLYNGTGYQHNPMMHGPFLFHFHALIYFLFGASDYTARIGPALAGVVAVMSPLLLRRWLGQWGTLLASIGMLISPLMLFHSRMVWMDMYCVIWTVVLVASLFHFLHSHRLKWFYLGAAVLMLSLATKETTYMFGFIAVVFLVELFLWERANRRLQAWLFVAGLILSLAILTGGVLLTRAGAQAAAGQEGAGNSLHLLGALFTVVGMGLLPGLVSTTLIRSRHPLPSRLAEAIRSIPRRAWLLAALVMALIYALLFTTFFTNPAGLLTGIAGSLSYWLPQQQVARGGQPWYYYLLLLAMYEFLPLLIGLIAIVYYLVRGRGGAGNLEESEEEGESEALGPGGSRPVPRGEESVFIAFLVAWTLGVLVIYGWSSEKMPWNGVHLTLPLIMISSKFMGDRFSQVDWRAIWQRGGALLAALLPITLLGLYTLISKRPFQGLSIFKLQETGSWLLALFITLLLLALTGLVAWRLKARQAGMVALATLIVIMGFFTVRFAWMAAYINRDYATELMVYAHGTPDVPLTMNEIADLSRRTTGDKLIEVAYDNEVTWPLEWYMREYPNRKYYGDHPTREALSVPVVLYSERNESKVTPFLGDRYNCFKRRLVWWPNQQYFDLTWKRVFAILGSPQKRKALWDILYWRKYPKTTAEWYHVHNFYLCVRKDVAQQIWNFGAVPPEVSELPPDPYTQAHRDLTAELVWGTVGTGPGQFNHPRGVAVGPDGDIYVVDSDNGRVQVFGADGSFRRAWGSSCELSGGQGCVDPDGDGPLSLGDGQFKEPWGIAVDSDGRVYVADTWNHRIQVFDANGTFLAKWGAFGQTAALESIFYGPRDVAIDAAGRVLVSDTGNKRVLVYDREGVLLAQFGGGGAAPGNFEEPVGLGVDAEGNIYVADTWNQRVQVFDRNYLFRREWSVDAWYGQSVVNKPFLAVDAEGRVYITDPEGYRVDVFSSDGALLATFGMYGVEANSFSLPTGIEIDSEGKIYVTDTDGQRVMRFGPLP